MANIRHSKVSGIPNPVDPTLVGGEDWDAAHDVTLVDGDIPATIARDAEVTAAVAALSTVYQPLDSDLTAIAALTTTAYGRAFLALADAAAGRTALGLGSAATAATGDFDLAGAAAAAQAASQPLDSDLTAIAALSTTAYGRSLLAAANAAALRTLAGTVIGTDVDAFGAAAAAQAASQPLDSDLTAIAALTTTAFGRGLLALADAAALRSSAGLGTLATQNGTFSGTSSGTNTGDQTLPTRASLGLDTTDSPQFAGLNIGAATDTTVTRTGAGDIAVEGNAIYRAGGTDVPIGDGGTGASSKAAAFDALSPMTTAADLIVGGAAGTGARLAKGADGQVLTVDPTTHLLVWATPGGGADLVQTYSGGGSVYIPGMRGDSDRLPGSPSAFDDEFNTTSTLTTALGTLDQNNTTDVPSHLHLKRALAAVGVVGVYKTAPSMPFTVTAKMRSARLELNNNFAGIMLTEASPGKLFTFNPAYNADAQSWAGYRWTNLTTFATQAFIATGAEFPHAAVKFLRIVVASSSSITCQVSVDGYIWITFASAQTTNLTVANVGLCIGDLGSAHTVEAVFDWIRFE